MISGFIACSNIEEYIAAFNAIIVSRLASHYHGNPIKLKIYFDCEYDKISTILSNIKFVSYERSIEGKINHPVLDKMLKDSNGNTVYTLYSDGSFEENVYDGTRLTKTINLYSNGIREVELYL